MAGVDDDGAGVVLLHGAFKLLQPFVAAPGTQVAIATNLSGCVAAFRQIAVRALDRRQDLLLGLAEADVVHRIAITCGRADSVAQRVLDVIGPVPPRRPMYFGSLIWTCQSISMPAKHGACYWLRAAYFLFSSSLILPLALPKSILPAKRSFSAAMARPMSFMVSALISCSSDEMADPASTSDICCGR